VARRRQWKTESRANQLPPPQLRRTRPTGRLRLLLPNGYRGGRASWSDGVRGPLERKLPSILRALDARASADHRASIERARRTDELLREQAARAQRARHLRIESARVERLLSEVSAWRRSAEIRGYLAALDQRLPTLDGDEHAVIAEWTKWAKDWADRSDPSRNTSMIIGIDDERDAR
jgi:hypothetical protein